MANEKKPFYKTGWGIVLDILFLPIFLIWLVWSKTEWKSYVKGIVTALIIFFSFGVMASAGNPTPPTTETPKTNQEQKVETKQEKVNVDIDFETQKKDDATLAKGTTKVQQEGQKGIKEQTWEITLSDGKQTGRKLLSEKVIKEAVPKIVLSGTKEAVTVPTETETTASSGTVKKSSTGICHAPGTTYYDRTLNYTSYSTLQACLSSGGRLPKN